LGEDSEGREFIGGKDCRLCRLEAMAGTTIFELVAGMIGEIEFTWGDFGDSDTFGDL